MSTNYTLTYDEGVKGFPSFYSFFPDFMMGMNNYFYTFKGGNLYRHNTNSIRNQYYGVNYSSNITSVFNENPLVNKVFKTIALESDDAWSFNGSSDQQTGNFIESSFFKLKEGDYYAFLRAEGTTETNVPGQYIDIPANSAQFPLRSVNGIANCTTVDATNPASVIINFALDISIGSILSVGDLIYFGDPNVSPITPTLGGVLLNINVDLQNSINQIIIDTTITNTAGVVVGQAPSDADYIFFIKSGVAESHGLLGHYCVFELRNNNTAAVELFAVMADVMKSFP